MALVCSSLDRGRELVRGTRLLKPGQRHRIDPWHSFVPAWTEAQDWSVALVCSSLDRGTGLVRGTRLIQPGQSDWTGPWYSSCSSLDRGWSALLICITASRPKLARQEIHWTRILHGVTDQYSGVLQSVLSAQKHFHIRLSDSKTFSLWRKTSVDDPSGWFQFNNIFSR